MEARLDPEKVREAITEIANALQSPSMQTIRQSATTVETKHLRLLLAVLSEGREASAPFASELDPRGRSDVASSDSRRDLPSLLPRHHRRASVWSAPMTDTSAPSASPEKVVLAQMIVDAGLRRVSSCANWKELLAADIAAALASNAEIERLTTACSRLNAEVSDVLGRALGYPWFKDDQENFPGATEADGVCIGDHVAESLADEAAAKITSLTAQVGRMEWRPMSDAPPADATIDVWGQFDADAKPRRYTGCQWRTNFKNPDGAWMYYAGWQSLGEGWGEHVWKPVGVPLAWMFIPEPPALSPTEPEGKT